MSEKARLLYTSDDVYVAIAHRLIAFDFHGDDISETSRALVYRDADTMYLHRSVATVIPITSTAAPPWSLEVGTQLIYEERLYQVALLGKKSAHLKYNDTLIEMPIDSLHRLYTEGKIVRQGDTTRVEAESTDWLKAASPKETVEAANRLKAIEGDQDHVRSVRTIQRYKRAMRDAGPFPGDRIAALVSKRSLQGNRNRRLPEKLSELIAQVVRREFNTPTNITKKAAFKKFVEEARGLNLVPCSERSFLSELRRHQSTRARKGKRRAYNEEPIVWYLIAAEPIHGVRPFQLIHADHTQLDIEVVARDGKTCLGKPWLSLAIDAASRRIVGFFLSLQPPSYRSCMMLLRDIVRRFGRMPETFVLDNGKEFRGNDFKRVAFTFESHVRYRPAGKPRFGSVMERVFGTINAQFIHLLRGNTQLMKYVRQVTKSVRPEQFAEWTMPQLYAALEYYFEKVYGQAEHPAHGMSPIAYFEQRLVETGMRTSRWVKFDENLLVETAPSVDGGTRVVDGRRGIKINNIWYWHPRLATPELARKPIEVRVDPWDVRYVFVLIANKWYRAESRFMASMRCYSEYEFAAAMEEVLARTNKARRTLTEQEIREHLFLLDAKNFASPEAEANRDIAKIYRELGMIGLESPPNPGFVPLPAQLTPPKNEPDNDEEDDSEEDYPLL